MTDKPTIFVVDDDPAMRDSLQALLESSGMDVRTFASAGEFLAGDAPARRGCLIADIRMPDMDGLELQQALVDRHAHLPVIVMTGHGDVALAVRAMKAGAVDFLEKPFEESVLLKSVERALSKADTHEEHSRLANEAETRLSALTERERDVLNLLVAGKANKVIAHELSISPRTVEIHRGRVMEKTGVRSLAELVRLAMSAGY
mgnify:FL=1